MAATADSVNFTESRDGGLPTYDLETPKPESLKNFENGGYAVPTSAHPSDESHRHEDEAALAEGEGTQVATVTSTALTTRRPATDGIRTFGGKYLPFAAGFENLADVAPVYRSPRLNAINPTAAVSDDVSYYYTLDSGRTTTASAAANPHAAKLEHVRNTGVAVRGGFMGSLLKPID